MNKVLLIREMPEAHEKAQILQGQWNAEERVAAIDTSNMDVATWFGCYALPLVHYL